MQQRFQQGNTTTSRVKALWLCVDRLHGRAQSDAFLLSTRLDREYMEDETRPVSVQLWHQALRSFASRFGSHEIDRIVAFSTHPENLGVWERVLRGADSPEDAYRQLSHHGGEEALTDRWETLEVTPGRWVGRITVPKDDAEERDGLRTKARAAELSSLTLLFGLGRAETRSRVMPSANPGLLEVHYDVRWKRPRWPWLLPVAMGALGYLAVHVEVVRSSDMPSLLACVLGGIVGFLVTWVIVMLGRARTTRVAHLIRLKALERSLSLREARDRKSSAGLFAGGVIAGQYRLGEKLGIGASGTIWEATRLSDGQIVAVKLLRAAVAHDTVAADRLRREAAALGLAWHPNVVEVYDDGHLPDGTSYLVMERMYGESLAERLKRLGTLKPEALLPIALQVCDALGAVHAAGIIHRDLKPSNIYLAKVPERNGSEAGSAQLERVKLLDFGIARVEWAETRLTNAGAALGTPGYMSPEQEQGMEIDARSDLFSLGSILFECLTGRLPPLNSAEFHSEPQGPRGESSVQVAFHAIPEAWRRIIERATDPLPRNRYPDSRSMKDELLALAQQCSSESHPTSQTAS